MKKKYKRIIKGILFICLSFFICLNVNAKDECPKYRNVIDVTNNTDNREITVKITEGTWKAILTKTEDISDENDNTYLGKSVDLNENNPTTTFTYDENQNIRIIFIYNADDKCYVNGPKIIERIKNNNSYSDLLVPESQYYVITKSFQAIGSNQSEIGNPYYNSQLCSDFLSGRWNEKFYPYVTEKVFEYYNPAVVGREGQIEYESYVPFCYKSNISVSADEKLVSRIIGGAVSTYYFKHKPTSSTIEKADGAQDWNPSKKIGLTCDLLKLKGTNDNDYANTNTYVHTKYTEEPINGYTCTKTCQEVLTVEYGPPVASKAGLCFEYKVRVTSKVTCDTNGKDVTPPKLEDYKVCEPVAYCESTSTASNDISAGPNEDFDSCVNTCDNGKYTQKCINKCYKQVYENNNSQLLNYADKVEATKLAACTGKIADKIPNGAELSNEILQHSGEETCYGKYVREKSGDYSSKISWSPGATYWTKYARYYFLTANIAQQTVNHDIVNKGNGTGKITNHGKEYRYYKSSTPKDLQHGWGFKIAASWSKKDGSEDTPAGGFKCNWNCSFIKCDGAKYINQADANKDYEDAYKNYETFIKRCSAEASCSTTTAEFTINVNNKTKDNPDDDNWIDYKKATLQNPNGTSVDITDSSNIIIDRSACYGKTVEPNAYMTEWSFPGTWINNKTGEISYEPPKTDTTWHKKENEFCTSLNTANTNVGWWYYGFTGKKINGVTGEAMTDQDLKNAVTDLNIKATARNFGHFGWNIDIECFYAYYDPAGEPVPPPPDPKKCIDKNCDDIEDKDPSQRYRIRTVSNSDLFPSPEGKETTNLTEPGRQPGFNWTVSATNIKNPNYIIAPSALLAEIQTKGDSIYSDDSNVDYEFYLDRNALSSIRKHITSGNYTNFTGKFSIINGVSVYSSSLFRESNNAAEVSLDSKYVIKRGILGCNNEENGKCYNYPSLTSIGG